MMDKPYILAVVKVLQNHGYHGDQAMEILIKYYRIMRRTLGFVLNPEDFAREIVDIDKNVKRKYDPNDPNQVYIGHLSSRLKKNKYPKQ
jgi:hypothetical protein